MMNVPRLSFAATFLSTHLSVFQQQTEYLNQFSSSLVTSPVRILEVCLAEEITVNFHVSSSAGFPLGFQVPPLGVTKCSITEAEQTRCFQHSCLPRMENHHSPLHSIFPFSRFSPHCSTYSSPVFFDSPLFLFPFGPWIQSAIKPCQLLSGLDFPGSSLFLYFKSVTSPPAPKCLQKLPPSSLMMEYLRLNVHSCMFSLWCYTLPTIFKPWQSRCCFFIRGQICHLKICQLPIESDTAKHLLFTLLRHLSLTCNIPSVFSPFAQGDSSSVVFKLGNSGENGNGR